MEIKYHGHSCFELSDGETTLLIDPFLKPNNPVAVASAEDVEPTHVALSHGHAPREGARGAGGSSGTSGFVTPPLCGPSRPSRNSSRRSSNPDAFACGAEARNSSMAAGTAVVDSTPVDAGSTT